MQTKRFRVFYLFADITILTLSFLFMVWTKPASVRDYLPTHTPFFVLLALLWLLVSILNGKMNRGMVINLKTLFLRVLTSNLISLALVALIMYLLREVYFSRFVVFGTVIIATAAELVIGIIFLAYKKAIIQEPELKINGKADAKPSEADMVAMTLKNNGSEVSQYELDCDLVNAIALETSEEMACSIASIIGKKTATTPVLLSTGTLFNIRSLHRESHDYIINLRKMNLIKGLDEFLDTVNSRLRPGGYYLCCVETKDKRKEKFLKRYPPVLNYIFYTLDFLYNRVLPKLRLTKSLYINLTGGKNMVISRAEALGRLCRAGFSISQESFIGDMLCIEAVKESAPKAPINQNYGILIALNRIGRGGELFKVYKLRTMHPYSEYIQEYIYSKHELKEGGKFQNDFRITSWGAVCRESWLDELPMLINLFRGDMKIVGVRPLSQQYFELYSKEIQDLRIKYKPGLVPPFYVDMPSDIEAIQESERRYLTAYDRSPFRTDVSYFFRSIWNIIFHHARSN